jgi:hypothetical protein
MTSGGVATPRKPRNVYLRRALTMLAVTALCVVGYVLVTQSKPASSGLPPHCASLARRRPRSRFRDRPQGTSGPAGPEAPQQHDGALGRRRRHGPRPRRPERRGRPPPGPVAAGRARQDRPRERDAGRHPRLRTREADDRGRDHAGLRRNGSATASSPRRAPRSTPIPARAPTSGSSRRTRWSSPSPASRAA